MREVLAKVALGEADAGFVYSTDARTVPGKVTVIKVPAWAQPKVQLRDLRRQRSAQQGGRAGVHQQGARARPDRRSCSPTASCRASSPSRPTKKYRRHERDGSRPTMRDARVHCLLVALSVVTLAFLAFPIVAIFAHVSPGHLFDQLSNPVVTDAFVVSLKTSVLAQVADPRSLELRPRICSPRKRFPGRSLADHAGRAAARAAACRRGHRAARRVRPRWPARIEPRRARDRAAVHADAPSRVAVAFVASPLYVRQAIAAFEAVDPNLSPPRARSARARRARSSASSFRSRAAGSIAGLALSLRARARRVRRDDHVRRQPAGRHADAPARDLRGVRPELRRRRSRSAACSCSISVVLLLGLRLGLTWQPSSSTRSPFLFGPSSLELSLELDATVALVGPSGPGKTTVLRAVAGLLRPASGRIAMGERSWFDGERASLSRRTGDASVSSSRTTRSSRI